MNGFNYDYLNYLNNIPSNIIPDTNYIKYGNVNYVIPNNENNYNNNSTVDPYLGFIRGNLFENLYNPYKNYKVKNISPSNEKEALLNQLQQYNFALIDLNLYLDINPNDNIALKLYNDYLNIKKELEEKYESSYGPIDVCSNFVANGNWNWDNGPWPWEVFK